MKLRWVYILIGNDKSGKTTFQKEVVKNLTSADYDERLTCNIALPINTTIAKSVNHDIFVMNRSFQEKVPEYKDVGTYFTTHFQNRDICILSSHVDLAVIKEMIEEARSRFYSVCAVFFDPEPSETPGGLSEISRLTWDDRICIENPPSDEEGWRRQIKREAFDFSCHIVS